ncbi:hypothetical protein C0989_005432, partial [Termitomyces sp. Mn162]
MDNVLAILFTGPCQPTEEELKHLPLLVHQNSVRKALEWLKLNHAAYIDVKISNTNLDSYSESVPSVSIVYQQSLDEANMVDPAVHTVEGVNSINAGEFLFVVHGLTGEELSAKTKDELKGIALKHWESNGKALA